MFAVERVHVTYIELHLFVELVSATNAKSGGVDVEVDVAHIGIVEAVLGALTTEAQQDLVVHIPFETEGCFPGVVALLDRGALGLWQIEADSPVAAICNN